MSQVAVTTFSFDLQRFDYVASKVTSENLDQKWKYGETNIGGHTLTKEDIEGYTSQSNHKIAVDADGDGNYDRYFDYFQSATNYILGNAVAASVRSNTAASVAAGYSANGATIKLLDDITDADGFYIGATKDDTVNNRLKTKATIDLNGHQVLFKYELAKGNAGGVRKAKAFVVEGNGTEDNGGTEITITGGTIGTAEDSNANFERLVRSYANLTFHNVVLDGSKLSPQQEANFDGAVLCHTKGVLNLTGNTEIKTQGDDYYAVSGKLANTGGNAGTFNINVKDNASIPNIGIFEWGTSDYWSLSGGTSSFAKGAVSISGGTVGNIAFSERAVQFGAMDKVTINGGNVNSITYSNNASSLLTAYAENSIDVDYDTVTKTNPKGTIFGGARDGHGVLYYLGSKNTWNASSSDSDKFNYVATSVGAADTLKAGKLIISADGVTDKTALNFDGGHSIFAIPESANFSWGGTDSVNYAAAKFAFDSSNTAVTVSGAVVGSGMTSGASIYSGTYSIGSVEHNGILSNKVAKIDASSNNVAMAIRGNSLDNTIYGGDANDTITGNGGQNTFYYSKGADVITDFAVGDKGDKIVLTDESFAPDATKISVTSGNLIVGFNDDNSDKLTFNGNGNLTSKTSPLYGVKFENGKKSYTYTNYSIVDVTNGNANGITLTPSYIGYKLGSDGKFTDDTIGAFTALNPFQTIDGSAVSVTGGIEITGQAGKNYIIGSNEVANTLWGGSGNDTLKGGSKHNNVFKYTAGKDVIEGYSFSGGDKASVTADDIISAKSTRKGLEFTFKDNSNVLTFSPVNEFDVEKVLLSSNGFLTKDGYIDKASAANFKLFSGTKGNIDLSDALYGSGVVSSIDASLTKNSVTLAGGGSAIKSLIFGANGKKDLFEYGGGSVTISGYETATDRIDIGEIGPIDLFEIKGNDVAISVGGTQKDIISLGSVKDKEVLIHDADSKGNSFSKFVFHANGVLYNKETKPTEANIYSNVDKAFTADDSIKKIFLQSGVHSVSIQSGDNKATLDASAAGASLSANNQVGVSLIGGTNSNKFIGSDYADTFVYNGGKDMVNNFVSTGTGTADSIALADNFNIESAKITLSKKSIKFKFDSKNTLTLKGDSEIESLTANGKGYSYAKNAIVDGGQVSLTSQFSGTYKISKEDAGVIQYVYGDRVTKNLTFKGSNQGETFTGGQKKTTFKGGGGADSLVGGTGKDIFFYAKGDTGTTEINNFEFGVGKDRLKIANGTIGDISTISGGVKFAMTSGKKGDTSEIGYFELTKFKDKDKDKDNFNWEDVAIKANNTYYWFAQEAGEDISGNSYAAGDLITTTSKVTTRNVSACDIIDLGYSTNLVKSSVAFKVADSAFSFTGNKPTKKS